MRVNEQAQPDVVLSCQNFTIKEKINMLSAIHLKHGTVSVRSFILWLLWRQKMFGLTCEEKEEEAKERQ